MGVGTQRYDRLQLLIRRNEASPPRVRPRRGHGSTVGVQLVDDGVAAASRHQPAVDGERGSERDCEADGETDPEQAVVWGTDWRGGSNVIETVVSALRRKLGRHAGMIETVRGVGYRAARP